MFKRLMFASFAFVLFLLPNLHAQPSPSDSTWKMFQHDLKHTGVSPLTGNIDSVFCLWAFDVGAYSMSSTVIGDIDGDGKSEVVVGSNDSKVYAINGENGSQLWSFVTGFGIRSSPAIGDIDGDGKSEVAIGSYDSLLYVINGEDGSRLWSYKTGYAIISSAAIDDIDGDGKLEVVTASHDNSVYALNGENGSELWTYVAGRAIPSSPAIADIDNDGKPEVVVGSKDYKVYALNGEDGSKLWSYSTGGEIRSSPAIGDIDGDGKFEIVVGSYDNSVYALNGENGSRLWSYATSSAVQSSPAIADIDNDGNTDVVVGSKDYNIYALKGEDGSELWRYATSGPVNSSPAIGDIDSDGNLEIVIGSDDYYLYALNGEDCTQLWCYQTGGNIKSSPAIGDLDGNGTAEVVIKSNDDYVYAIKGDDNAPSSPSNLTADGDSPSPWKSDSIFHINWINPPDSTGIVKVFYKLGSEPVSDFDTTGSLLPTPPETLFNSIEGSNPLYLWLVDGVGNVDYNNHSSVELRYDISSPVINLTTVWDDTTYGGPFPVYSKVIDSCSGLDSVLLYYKREEDPAWFYRKMNKGSGGWYYENIPQAMQSVDTVKYYIHAWDKTNPANERTDPGGAPVNHYSFIANTSGVDVSVPDTFAFSVKSFVNDEVKFKFSIPENSRISLNIYDVTGRIVDTPIDGGYTRGNYIIKFRPKSKGVYFYRFKAPEHRESGKFIVF